MVIKLLPYMWSAWWRKTKQRGVWHGANTATVTVLAFVAVMVIAVISGFAARAFRQESFGQAQTMLEFCLNSALMGWLAIPVMVGVSTAEGRGLQPTRLGQFPLSLNQLMGVGILGHLVQPVYWLLSLGSLFVLLPLMSAPNPGLGMVAWALFTALSVLLAWSVELFGSAVFSSRHGRETMLVIALILMVPMWFLISADFEYEEGRLTIEVLDRVYLLVNEDGTEGLMAQMRAFSPAVVVSEAALGQPSALSLGLLALGVALTGLLARFSLRRVMLHPPSSVQGRKGKARSIFGWSWLPADVAPLVVKEVRYLTRTLDHLMGMAAGLVGMAWILVRPEHMIYVLPLGMVFIIYNESAIPLNAFGLDGPGQDRYRLTPLSSVRVLWSKNLAYFVVVAMQVVPLAVAGVLRGNPGLALASLLGTAAVSLVTAGGGNIASIKSPAPRAFFNFDSKEQTGGGLTLFLAFLLWVGPAVVFFGLIWINIWAVVLGQAVLMVIGWFVYRALLVKSAEMWEAGAENMRDKLGGE